MIAFNILDKFFKEGVYSSTQKTITVLKKEVIEEELIEIETDIDVIDFENFQIEETYLKRTYSYDEYGYLKEVIDETNYIV